MIRHVVVAMAVVLNGAPASGQDFMWLGSFDNVRSATGEHCHGYSLGLWTYRDRLIGLFDVHEGLCGDPPCATIADASLDAKTGRLRFAAAIDERRWTFDGTLGRDRVAGTLTGTSGTTAPTRERVRLARDKDGAGADFGPNRSLDAWCGFWTGVRRCRGVTELCAGLKSPD